MPRSFLVPRPISHSQLDQPGFLGRFVGTYNPWGPCGYVEATTHQGAEQKAAEMSRLYPNAWVGSRTTAWSWKLLWFVYRVDIWSRAPQ